MTVFAGSSKHIKLLVESKQSSFLELRMYHEKSGVQSILDFLRNKIKKKKTMVSKPQPPPCYFFTFNTIFSISFLTAAAKNTWWNRLMVFMLLHDKLKYSCAVLFTSGSYMTRLWVDCVCPQMNLVKVEHCWLQDSSPTVPPTIITHTQHSSDSKLCLPLFSFVHQTKCLMFYKSVWCIGTCLYWVFGGWAFQLMGFRACGVEPYGFCVIGALYKQRRINLGKNVALLMVCWRDFM